MSEQDKMKRPHHHGDLRNALVDAGIALLSEGGAQALTLRKCAARAGVSHAAPAHHFNGLAGLKHAIALKGYQKLYMMMANCDGCANPAPLTRLKSMCLCYIEFAVANPALFDEMFSINANDMIEGKVTKDLQEIYSGFRSFCLPFVRDDLPLDIIELQVRSFLRGYTLIAFSGQFGPKDKGGFPLGPVNEALEILDHLAPAAAQTPTMT
ncbi:TetR/AcrR family transcriptional regulator [Aliiroseovarius lamellibrachiae]|uniref:TetR/AcrR family transcriptional regulator n=1 Tax=Aliiroseovarius lamellibrachiae TaxID=1924933 RepID=UPI001BDF905E|nr:TetR/AcrR family transcriptional regulator [Aliiroseovarius lamellibrachiae]